MMIITTFIIEPVFSDVAKLLVSVNYFSIQAFELHKADKCTMMYNIAIGNWMMLN